MKATRLILGLCATLISCLTASAELPLPPPDLLEGWQRVTIPEVGTIDIPPTMEVQQGTYAQLGEAVKKALMPELDTPATPGGITIQQKGLNAFDPVAFKSYVRVMVESDIGKPGECEQLGLRFEVTEDEAKELSALVRAQVENPRMKILEWDAPSAEVVNGMQAIRFGYRRQYQDNPAVRVTTYMFQNHDRMHRLTMSYRESEQSIWLAAIPRILASFRITNIQSASSTGNLDPMAVVFGENWLLVLIVSAIMTWGIGLAPPLLTRFIFLRRPMSKVAAIVFVVAFLLINLMSFMALGSRSKTHAALLLVALVSYYILRAGSRKQGAAKVSPPMPHG